MPEERNIPSEFRAMWLFAMFDLPVDTRKARKAYAGFRKGLLRHGFSMLQFSVYARYCGSEEHSRILSREIRKILPEEGQIRLLAVTERQFGKMEVFIGKKRVETEEKPQQLMLF